MIHTPRECLFYAVTARVISELLRGDDDSANNNDNDDEVEVVHPTPVQALQVSVIC